MKTAMSDAYQTGLIVGGRKKRHSSKADVMLGSRVRLQHDFEPEAEDPEIDARDSPRRMKNRSRSLNTHKRIFGDLNVTL